jgi:hypothetical protein
MNQQNDQIKERRRTMKALGNEKRMMSYREMCWTSLLVAGLLALPASGALVQTNDMYEGNPYYFAPSASDLINAGQATLASQSDPVPAVSWGSSGWLNNGSNDYPGTGRDGDSWQVTFTLDTTANPFGYDIADIVTIAASNGWGGFRAHQTITVAYSTVGQSEFSTLGTYSNTSNTENNSCTKITLNDDGGAAILTGVDALQFTVSAATLMMEIDVTGTPTPEPATMLLLGSGGVLALRRKK